MAVVSQNYLNFIAELIGDKAVAHLAGIEGSLGVRLTDAGFGKAHKVLGKFLLFKKDNELFKARMMEIFKASSQQASECYNCFIGWCEEFMN